MSLSTFDPVTHGEIIKQKPVIGEAILVPTTFVHDDFVNTGSSVDAELYPGLAKTFGSGFSGETWEQISIPKVKSGLNKLGYAVVGYKYQNKYYLLYSDGYLFKSSDWDVHELVEDTSFYLAGKVILSAQEYNGNVLILSDGKLHVMTGSGEPVHSHSESSSSKIWSCQNGEFFLHSSAASRVSNFRKYDLNTNTLTSITHKIPSSNFMNNRTRISCMGYNGSFYFIGFDDLPDTGTNVYRSSTGDAGTWVAAPVGTKNLSVYSMVRCDNAIIVSSRTVEPSCYKIIGSSVTSITSPYNTNVSNAYSTKITSGPFAGSFVITSRDVAKSQLFIYNPTTNVIENIAEKVKTVSNLDGSVYSQSYWVGDRVIFTGSGYETYKIQTFCGFTDDLFDTIDNVSFLEVYDRSYDAPTFGPDGKTMIMMSRESLKTTTASQIGYVSTRTTARASGIKSSDGGKTWTSFYINSPSIDKNLLSWSHLAVGDSGYAIVAIERNAASTGHTSKLWVGTSDDLENWQWFEQDGLNMHSQKGCTVHLVGDVIVYHSSYPGTTVYYSTDFGETFTPVTLSAEAYDRLWYDPIGKKLYAVNLTGTDISISSDGINWQKSSAGGSMGAASHTMASTGDMVAIFGGPTASSMLLSTDGGSSWGVYPTPMANMKAMQAWSAGGLIGVADVTSNKYFYTSNGVDWSESTYAGLTTAQLYDDRTEAIMMFNDTSTTLDGQRCFLAGMLTENTGRMLVSKNEMFIPPVTDVPGGLKYVIRAKN